VAVRPGMLRSWDADSILHDAVLYRMLLLGEIASALFPELAQTYEPGPDPEPGTAFFPRPSSERRVLPVL
jgi:hypothetical protein